MPAPTPAPPIDGIAHLTLPVGDLARAESFYVELLGAQVIRRIDRDSFVRDRPERSAEADAPNSPLHLSIRFHDSPEIDLFLQRDGEPRVPQPHPHLALNVDHDDLDRFCARLSAAGVPTDGPRRLGPPGQASLYFADPWGNSLELTTSGYRGPVKEGPPDMAALAHR